MSWKFMRNLSFWYNDTQIFYNKAMGIKTNFKHIKKKPLKLHEPAL